MAAAGDTAVSIIADIVAKGPFILVVEGGIPTAFGGATCTVWTLNGSDVTMLTAVQALASKASAVMCVGTCASFGGVGAAAPNPTGVEPVSVAIGKPTINVAGCPPHPDWMIWTLAQILGNQTINVDKYGRPMYLYSNTVHMQCTRRSSPRATTFGQDTYCMRDMGCIGPYTYAHCPGGQWNNGANWCVDANSQCLGCTQPDFPQANLRS